MSQINSNTTLLQEILDDVNNLPSGEFSKLSIMVEGSRSLSLSASDFGSVGRIRPYAFYRHSDLTSIEIPEGVSEIGQEAFDHCSDLLGVTIPSTVTNIYSSAFYGCKSLARVDIKATTPPYLWQYVFSYTPDNLQIVVPVGCADAYKSADGWSDYADLIVEATE